MDVWVLPVSRSMCERYDSMTTEYIYAEYKVECGSAQMAEIKQVMLHLDSYTEDELNLLGDAEILQVWVNNILDNQIENDWERLREIGKIKT